MKELLNYDRRGSSADAKQRAWLANDESRSVGTRQIYESFLLGADDD